MIKVTKKSSWLTEIKYSGCFQKTPFRIMFRSDAHHDNVKCDRELEKEHLEYALQNNIFIVDAGDLFCAMQGTGDPRGKKQDIRPEYLDGEYLDELVSHTSDDYKKYASQFALFLQGNHERTIMQRKETNLTERLGERLRCHGFKGLTTGVCQFIRIKDKDGMSYIVYVEHGYGGGGPVTKSLIQDNRRGKKVSGVDAIVSGHIHQRVEHSDVVLEYGGHGNVNFREVQNISLPTYKQEMAVDTWHTAQGRSARPLGCYILEVTRRRKIVNKVKEPKGLIGEWRYMR